MISEPVSFVLVQWVIRLKKGKKEQEDDVRVCKLKQMTIDNKVIQLTAGGENDTKKRERQKIVYVYPDMVNIK